MPLQFDLVSPERSLASLEVTEVRIPGAEGDLTAMEGHAPTITTLRPGLVTVVHAGGEDQYLVSGGFAEISSSAVSILAERSLNKGDVTQDAFDDMLAEFVAARQAAKEVAERENLPGPVDEAAKLLSDMVALGGQIGLSTTAADR